MILHSMDSCVLWEIGLPLREQEVGAKIEELYLRMMGE